MLRLIYGMATSQNLFGIAKTILRGQWKEKEGEVDRRRNGKVTFKNWQKWVRRFPEGNGKQVKVETMLLQRHLRCFDYHHGEGAEVRQDEPEKEKRTTRTIK